MSKGARIVQPITAITCLICAVSLYTQYGWAAGLVCLAASLLAVVTTLAALWG